MFESLEVRRLWTAGDLDPAFGANGRAEFALRSNSPTIAVLPNDKVLILTEGGDHQIGVSRYDADGLLDTSFDGDGEMSFAFDGDNTSTDAAELVLPLPNGGFLVGGVVLEDIIDPFGEPTGVARTPYLAKFNADGSPDASFGTDGVQQITDSISARNVAIQTDGKFVIAGGNRVVRLDSDGSFDNTFFSPFGFASLPNAEAGAFVNVVEVQSDGKIVVGGATSQLSDGDVALFRFNSNGTPDTTFGDEGAVTLDLPNFFPNAAVAIRETFGGKLVVGISHGPQFSGTFAAARLNSDGSLDATFGDDGVSIQNIRTDELARVRDLEIDSAGRIVLVAETSNEAGAFYLTRFNSDGSPDATFGRVYGGGPTLTYQSTAIALQSNDSIIVRTTADPLRRRVPPRGQLLRFEGSGSTPRDIRLNSKTLSIDGTSEADDVYITGAGETRVSLNGIGRLYDEGDILTANIDVGDGNDTVVIRSSEIDASLLGGNGDDGIETDQGLDTIHGGTGRDRLDGGALADSIDGGGGRDKIEGDQGDDTILGGSSGDWLAGGDGADSLIGGGGNDVLNDAFGSLDGDTLIGGAGNDLFFTQSGGFDDQIFGRSGRDQAFSDEDDAKSSIEELLAVPPEWYTV